MAGKHSRAGRRTSDGAPARPCRGARSASGLARGARQCVLEMLSGSSPTFAIMSTGSTLVTMAGGISSARSAKIMYVMGRPVDASKRPSRSARAVANRDWVGASLILRRGLTPAGQAEGQAARTQGTKAGRRTAAHGARTHECGMRSPTERTMAAPAGATPPWSEAGPTGLPVMPRSGVRNRV